MNNQTKIDVMKKLGPGYWDFIHYYSLSDATNNDFYFCMIKLSDIFPCQKCGQFLRKNVNTFNVNFTKMDRFRWTFNLHNKVNIKLSKNTNDLSLMYTHYNNKNLCEIKCIDGYLDIIQRVSSQVKNKDSLYNFKKFILFIIKRTSVDYFKLKYLEKYPTKNISNLERWTSEICILIIDDRTLRYRKV